MVSSDAVALLISLFSHCHVRLNVPETGERGLKHDTSRDVAFYDEVLTAQLSLHIPTSSALPPPQRGHATYALPISIDESEDDPLEERTEQARATRLALLALLSCLNIDLRGSYVSPRAPLPAGSNVVPPTTAATPTSASNVPHHQRPIPSLDPKDAAYAEPSLPGDEAFFYSTAWQGNKAPSDPPSRNTASERIKARRRRHSHSQDEDKETTASSYVTWDQAEERWLVTWTVKVPVIYTRHRHPRPAMLLTSSLALRVSGSSTLLTALDASLTGGSPFLALLHPEASPSWSDHDLLTSLSAGPVYPDESPSQRAARAASALAKLPLSRLPSKVLGSRLVTPERSARDVGRKLSSHIAPPSMSDEDADDDQEGDVTDSSGTSSARKGALSSSSSSSSSSSRPSSVSSYSHDGSFARHRELSEKGLVARADPSSASDLNKGEAVVTLHRSARCAMDVRSGVGAKMRTTTVENVNLAALQRRRPQQEQQDEDGETDAYTLDEEGPGGAGRALLLCVELDNLSESGILFEVESCELDITVPNANPHSASKFLAKATLMESSDEHGFHLAQGEQRNLLYFVHFEVTPENATLWPYTDAAAPPPADDAHRNVAIVVHGRPLLLAGEGREPRIVTPHFSSTWNCTLDMQALDRDLRRKTAASLPMPEVLESAVALDGARNAKAPAVAVGGSLKHSASALSAAAERDIARRQEQQQQQVVHPTRPNPPGRINTGSVPTPSPLTPTQRSNSLQAPSDGHSRLSPSPLGGGPSAWLAASPALIPPDPSLSQRIPSLGAGLLAQARLRASSAQQRVVSDATGTDTSLTPRVASSANRFASFNSTSRRAFSSTSTRRTASGAVAPAVDMTPLEKEVLPLPFDRSLSASTPGDYLGGVLINANVKATNTIRQLDVFDVELFVSNRSDRMKSFVFSWSTVDDDPLAPANTRLNRSSSTSSLTMARTRLRDAQAIYKSHLDTRQTQASIVPLDQDVSTGAIASGQSVRVYMPLQALSAGVHTLSDLRVYDEETGSERVLRCGGGGGGGGTQRSAGACVVVVEAS